MKATPEQIAEYERMALERGGTVQGPQPEAPASPKRPALVEPCWALTDDMRRLLIVVAHAVRSEANGRDWKQRSNRTKAAREAVRKALGNALHALSIFEDHWARGGALRVVFTKLNGRRLDSLANLGASLKAIEDALAYLLGASDGDAARWLAACAQEPGPGPEGVRIELTCVEGMQ